MKFVHWEFQQLTFFVMPLMSFIKSIRLPLISTFVLSQKEALYSHIERLALDHFTFRWQPILAFIARWTFLKYLMFPLSARSI